MPIKRWASMLVLLAAVGCQGEVPVAVDDETGKTEAISDDAPEISAEESGFVALDFADFTPFLAKPAGEKPTWSTDSGVIRTTGTPRGYLYTNNTYDNFTLRGEFRYIPREEPVALAEMQNYNTGFLIHVPDEHKIWPRSLEVQGRLDQIGQVKSNARDLKINVILDDHAARETARKPVGEWNTIEIISKDGAVTSFLNGAKISESEPGELKSGYIGLQAEDYAVEFRGLRIREE